MKLQDKMWENGCKYHLQTEQCNDKEWKISRRQTESQTIKKRQIATTKSGSDFESERAKERKVKRKRQNDGKK